MSNVFKIALPGYNVFTETDPDNFSLFVDNQVDHILIKESARGSVTVANGATENIAHGLSGYPFCLVFVEESSGVWRKVMSTPIDSVGYSFVVSSTNLSISNSSGSSADYKYYIFYDRVAS